MSHFSCCTSSLPGRIAAIVCTLVLLAGCGGKPGGVGGSGPSGGSAGGSGLEGGSGLVRAYSLSVAGTSYTVFRASGRRNHFRISTDDGGPGKRRQMAKVVWLAYGCHSLELTEIKPEWQEAEARGAVCNGGFQRYR